MSVFAVISVAENHDFDAKVTQTYGDEKIRVSPTVWFVSDGNVTAAQVCEKLGVRTATASSGFTHVVVVQVQGYFGHATAALWQWLLLKGVAP